MNIKALLLGLAAIAGASYLLFATSQKDTPAQGISLDAKFALYKAKFGKTYGSPAENKFRTSIFAASLNRIAAHNARSEFSYKLGLNQFSDMTIEEKRAKYLTTFPEVKGDAKCEKTAPAHLANNNKDDKVVDWVAAGKVQAVKDQQQCGSCWAFATAGALESAYAVTNNVAVPSISEQELVDCSQDYGNMGCNGGLMSYAYDYILDHKINSEKKYPYVGEDQDCNKKLSGKGIYSIKGCVQVKPDVQGLTDAIRITPIAIAFYVQDDFFDYTSGVYNPTDCDDQPNHGVLAVGFDLSAKLKNFYVKNSWGAGWGDKGFFRIAMGKGKGTCDIAGSGWNYYPTVNAK